jgi:hypothetical protein
MITIQGLPCETQTQPPILAGAKMGSLKKVLDTSLWIVGKYHHSILLPMTLFATFGEKPTLVVTQQESHRECSLLGTRHWGITNGCFTSSRKIQHLVLVWGSPHNTCLACIPYHFPFPRAESEMMAVLKSVHLGSYVKEQVWGIGNVTRKDTITLPASQLTGVCEIGLLEERKKEAFIHWLSSSLAKSTNSHNSWCLCS